MNLCTSGWRTPNFQPCSTRLGKLKHAPHRNAEWAFVLLCSIFFARRDDFIPQLDMPVCDIVRTALNATEIKRMALIQKLNAENVSKN